MAQEFSKRDALTAFVVSMASLVLGFLLFVAAYPMVESAPPPSPWYTYGSCIRLGTFGGRWTVVGVGDHYYVLEPAGALWHEQSTWGKIVRRDVLDEVAVPTTCPPRSEPSWAKKRSR